MKITLLLCLFFLSCTRKETLERKELHRISLEKITGLDPINASDVYTSAMVGNVFEGLFEFHPFKRPYEIVPNLAESLPKVGTDGLTYTIKLRDQVYFQDNPCFKNGRGRKLVADDVIYSLKRLADPKLQAKGWWVLDGKIQGLNEWREKNKQTKTTNYEETISGLQKIDDLTLKFTLERPFPQFIYALAMAFTSVVPHEAIERYREDFLYKPVGTGPFILENSNHPNRFVFTRNAKYRKKLFPIDGAEKYREDAGKPLPLVDRVIVEVVTESRPAWFMFDKGKIDSLTLSRDNFSQVLDQNKNVLPNQKAKGIELDVQPRLDISYIAFNHDLPLFRNLKLRRAMSLAYDRKKANELFYEGTSQVATGVIPPGLGGYSKDHLNPYTEYNPAKAKELLREAGYPEGKGLPVITVELRTDTLERQMMEHFSSCMSTIGIRLKANTNTWPELKNKVNTGQAQMYFMAWGADYPDAENFLQLLYCPNKAPGPNGANYCDPVYDRKYQEAVLLQDSPERSKMYAELNQLASDAVPWILMFNRRRYTAYHGWIKNFTTSEFSLSMDQYLDVDLKKKERLLKLIE